MFWHYAPINARLKFRTRNISEKASISQKKQEPKAQPNLNFKKHIKRNNGQNCKQVSGNRKSISLKLHRTYMN